MGNVLVRHLVEAFNDGDIVPSGKCLSSSLMLNKVTDLMDSIRISAEKTGIPWPNDLELAAAVVRGGTFISLFQCSLSIH